MTSTMTIQYEAFADRYAFDVRCSNGAYSFGYRATEVEAKKTAEAAARSYRASARKVAK